MPRGPRLDAPGVLHYVMARGIMRQAIFRNDAFLKHIRVLPKTINEICRGKRGISADMAMKLSKALGGSPQFWLNLQNNWELSQLDETDFKDIDPVAA